MKLENVVLYNMAAAKYLNLEPYQGFYINTYEANMRSSNSRMVNNQFQDDTWTRVTWVINREDLTMICYVNAIITKCIYITDIENFRLDKETYLGASFDEVDDNLDSNGNPIPHYASCAIKTFRIYDRPLTDEEVLHNHIADIKNKEEFKRLEKEAYYGILDVSSFPAAEYKYFDTIMKIGYEYRHEGMPKDFCAERESSAYKNYLEDVKIRESRQRYWREHQDNIIKSGNLRSKIQKAKNVEEKLKFSLECIELMTGEQGFAKRILRGIKTD